MRARRALGTAAALSLMIAFWAPLVAVACSAGGSAVTNSGQASFLDSIDVRSAFFIVLAGFLFVLAQVAIPVAFAMRRRRREPAPVAQMSPDARYWWDGRAWHPLRGSG